MKKLIVAFALLFAGVVNAERYEYEVVEPLDLIAGDYLTVLNGTAISDNSKPWLVKGAVSRTAAVLGDVAGTTATAVTFNWTVPSNFKGDAALFAVVEPVATDETVKLRADVQKQDRTFGSSPTIVTSVTQGSESTALPANADGELNWVALPNNALANLTERDRRKQINVYVGRSSGTGENLRIYNFYIRYSFRDEANRLRD